MIYLYISHRIPYCMLIYIDHVSLKRHEMMRSYYTGHYMIYIIYPWILHWTFAHLPHVFLRKAVTKKVALGLGFRCGFLGVLHMEVIKERSKRWTHLVGRSPIHGVPRNGLNHRKTVGKWWFHGGWMGFYGIYPLVVSKQQWKITVSRGKSPVNGPFSSIFQSYVTNYQRVMEDPSVKDWFGGTEDLF